MVIARASPNAKVSPDKNNANWPPKSPYEALLSSPSGRKRLEDLRQRDISPSPRARSVTTSHALRALQDDAGEGYDDDDDDEETEDEDEETLRLKLQAIEAKLKLKKLQAKKKQKTNLVSSSSDVSLATTTTTIAASPRIVTTAAASKSSLLPGVQIPVSPIKDRMPPPPLPNHNTSPARVLLGIDKGLKASDVSLKRARTATTRPSVAAPPPDLTPKPTFSQRLAATRLSNDEQEAKQNRIQQSRSRGFALPSSSSAASLPTPSSSQPPSASTHKPKASTPSLRTPSAFTPNPATTADNPFLSRSRTTTAAEMAPEDRFSVIDDDEGKSTEPSSDGSSFESYSSTHLSRRKMPHTDLVRSLDGKEIYTLPRLLKEVKAPHYEPPDCEADFVFFAIIASKSSPYTTKAKHQTTSTGDPDPQEEMNPRNKFMVMTLTDLKWEIDLFLFDTAFTQFWKLTPGTLIAILNPNIMPPKTNTHNGRFSLKLASSEDGVLEIGSARDLGFCKSIKKDGKECAVWVNKRKSQFCDYHVELAVEKTRRSRMEVNAMYRPNNRANTTGGGNPSHNKPNSRGLRNGEFKQGQGNLKRDAESRAQYYMGGSSGFSAARLLDAEDVVGKGDGLRKRLAEKEKERVLGQKLARLGNGMGAEYLQASTSAAAAAAAAAAASTGGKEDNNKKKRAGCVPPSSSSGAETAAAQLDRPDAYDTDLDPAALGLLSKRAADVDLRPVRGRKRAFDSSASVVPTTGGGADAMGWGGANRRLGYNDAAAAGGVDKGGEKGWEKGGEKGQTKIRFPGGMARKDREESPRKRARFTIEGKGVREPGRESLGDGDGEVVRRDGKGRIIVGRAPDSSDDDLDIV